MLLSILMVSFSCTVLVILPRLTSFSVLEFEIIHQSCHHNTQKRLRLCSWTKYVTHRILLCLDLYSVRPLFAWGCLWIFLWKRKAIFFSFIYLLLLILKMSSKKAKNLCGKMSFFYILPAVDICGLLIYRCDFYSFRRQAHFIFPLAKFFL